MLYPIMRLILISQSREEEKVFAIIDQIYYKLFSYSLIAYVKTKGSDRLEGLARWRGATYPRYRYRSFWSGQGLSGVCSLSRCSPQVPSGVDTDSIVQRGSFVAAARVVFCGGGNSKEYVELVGSRPLIAACLKLLLSNRGKNISLHLC